MIRSLKGILELALTRIGLVSKKSAELRYWRKTLRRERTLANRHYAYFYTGHFGLEPADYAGKYVLDVGCGPRGSLEWASNAGIRIGIDPLAHDYRTLGTAEHEMGYVAASSEALPFPDGCFDIVCSFNSIDHVDHLEEAISEVKRVLRPGGLLLLLTELNHDATIAEPMSFSWEIMDAFRELVHVDVRHYERVQTGLYDSILAGVPYDHGDERKRYGILSAKMRKPEAA